MVSGDWEKEAVPLLRDFEKADRYHDAGLSRREEPSGRHDGVVPAVLRSKDDVPDLANDLVVGAPYFRADDLVGPQAGGELVDADERLGALVVTMALSVPPRCTFGSRALICLSAASSSLSPNVLKAGPARSSRMLPRNARNPHGGHRTRG